MDFWPSLRQSYVLPALIFCTCASPPEQQLYLILLDVVYDLLDMGLESTGSVENCVFCFYLVAFLMQTIYYDDVRYFIQSSD